MYLSRLEVSNVRNLLSLQINPHPDINFIVGANGSGKTSLLEAISLLSRGRSFRTPQIRKVVHHEHRALTVFGVITGADGMEHRLGVQREANGEIQVKIDGTRCERLSDLAQLLPTLDIESSSFDLVDGGSSARREMADWGLFHVEHEFLSVWKRYRAVLEQRNALLRATDRKGVKQFLPGWDQQLSLLSISFNSFRQSYVVALAETVESIGKNYFDLADVQISYQPGWNQQLFPELGDCLRANQQQELEKGRSLYGPHRADLDIRWQGKSVRDHCSRGQKKLVLYAVRLAQVALFQGAKGFTPILLLDDLAAELDRPNIERVSHFLHDYPCQSFITAIDKDIRTSGLTEVHPAYGMFHVEHGQLVHPTSTHL